MKKLFSIVVLSVMLLLPFGAKAAILKPACEKNTDCPVNGVCTTTCELRVTGNTTPLGAANVTWTFNSPEGVEIKSVTPGDGWTNVTTNFSGQTVPLSFIATSPATASEFKLATLVIEHKAGVDCSAKVSFEGGPAQEVKIETTTTVKTGATLPIAIIACGACAAVVIYLATKKNKKMYKI